jgi:hypothetical protein
MFHLGKHIPQRVPDTYGFTGINASQCTRAVCSPTIRTDLPRSTRKLPVRAPAGGCPGRPPRWPTRRRADGRAGIVIDESNTCGLGKAGAGTPAHYWPLTATGAAISHAIAALGAAITTPDRPDSSPMDTTSGSCTPAPENLDVTTVTDNNGADDIVRIEPHPSGPGPPPAPTRPTSSIWSHTGCRRTRRGYRSCRTSRPHRRRARPRPPRHRHPTRTRTSLTRWCAHRRASHHRAGHRPAGGHSSPSWAPGHVLIRLRACQSNPPIVCPGRHHQTQPPSDGRGGSQPTHMANHPDGQGRTRCSPRHRRRQAAGRYLLPGDASTNNGDGLSRTPQLRRRGQHRHPGCRRRRPPCWRHQRRRSQPTGSRRHRRYRGCRWGGYHPAAVVATPGRRRRC